MLAAFAMSEMVQVVPVTAGDRMCVGCQKDTLFVSFPERFLYMIRALRKMQSCCLMVHSLYSSMTDEDLNVNEETKYKNN